MALKPVSAHWRRLYNSAGRQHWTPVATLKEQRNVIKKSWMSTAKPQKLLKRG